MDPKSGLILGLLLSLYSPAKGAKFKTNSYRSSLECPGADLPLIVSPFTTPFGGNHSGIFVFSELAQTLEACFHECCLSEKCDALFFHNSTCFKIQCRSDRLCRPLTRPEDEKFSNSYMIQLRSVGFSRSTVAEALVGESEEAQTPDDLNSDISTPLFATTGSHRRESHELPDTSDFVTSVQSDYRTTTTTTDSNASSNLCVIGSKIKDLSCGPNERCEKRNKAAKSGRCVCVVGYDRVDESGLCFKTMPIAENPISEAEIRTVPSIIPTPFEPEENKTAEANPTDPPFTHLVVTTGGNQVVQLPQNSTSIEAFALPESNNKSEYKYEWTFVSHPLGDAETGTMNDANTNTIKLNNLRKGLYTFKIVVTGNNAYGENMVNVTVVAPKRANTPPVAIVQPVTQVVQLPNQDTVLDGSSSTDDDKIVNYKWEPVAQPIGYKSPFGLELNNTPTLQLKNLLPGFYQLKLTVIDSDNVANSTIANLTVLKEKDYPPTANAGADAIVNLPLNEVILNGNLSTDDKGITGWQWTRSPDDDKGKAVDMDGTSTPLLHLSKLELGVYKFTLKVTDTANQTSTAEVHVFVKPETFKGPFVNAGVDQQVNLPLEGPVFLDGTKSTDDSPAGIVAWKWGQVSGPKEANFENSTASKTRVSNLIPGDYKFKLTVINGRGSNSTANMSISVIQAKNTPPKALAGGDRTVVLPASIVVMNGSGSYDDAVIVNFSWTREPESLAAGDILNGSNSSPILLLTNLIAGRYLFRLTVADKQGATSSDVASLIVKPSPDLNDQVQLMLNTDIASFSADQEITTLKRLELLLNDGRGESLKISKVKLDSQTESKRVVLVFTASTVKNKLVSGPVVVQKLKDKLRLDINLIEPGVLSLDTVVCQNTCSGHGTCDQTSKRCVCEAFWMGDVFRIYFGDDDTNCDWSILYVVIISFILIVSICGLFWSLVCFFTRKPSVKQKVNQLRRRRRNRARPTIDYRGYTLLDRDMEDNIGKELNNLDAADNLGLTSKTDDKKKKLNFRFMSSDSDSEDVTIFDSTTRTNNILNKERKRSSTSSSSLNGLVNEKSKVQVKA